MRHKANSNHFQRFLEIAIRIIILPMIRGSRNLLFIGMRIFQTLRGIVYRKVIIIIGGLRTWVQTIKTTQTWVWCNQICQIGMMKHLNGSHMPDKHYNNDMGRWICENNKIRLITTIKFQELHQVKVIFKMWLLKQPRIICKMDMGPVIL